MNGRVTQLFRGRLCGSILTSDGRTVFFHGRDLEGARYNDLEVGDTVTFDLIVDAISGDRAAKVKVPRARATKKR